MEILVGIVKSNEDNTESGRLQVQIPALENRVETVTFTSPYYRMNSGGMVAIPENDTQVLVLHNKNPREGESSFYFHSCVVYDTPRGTNDGINKDFVTLRNNDPKAKIYATKPPFSAKPVTQMFTNSAGAGLYIQRDFATPTMSNNVTLKSEMDAEVNVGALGVQIRNEEGDSINLAGSNGGDFYADRSLNISTKGPQEYKCTNSDINMRVIDGGDINIENDSTGMMSFGSAPGMPQPPNPFPGVFPWSGNIRLKSRYRNIDLAALGEFSNINIVTKNAKIKLDSMGNVEVHTTGLKAPITGTPIIATGNIKLTSQQGNIELDAPLGKVRINGGIGVDIGSSLPVGMVNVNAPLAVNLNAAVINRNGLPSEISIPVGHGGGPTSKDLPPLPLPGVIPPILPTPLADMGIPDPQNIPSGSGPTLNDYRDGSVLGGAV